MPWKTNDDRQARRRFVQERLMLKGGGGMRGLCRRHGISRQCGYRWWRRYKSEGPRGLRPRVVLQRAAQRLHRRWWERLCRVRQSCRNFGPKKLHWELQRVHPGAHLPAVRTLARWLAKMGLVRAIKRRARPGPPVRLPGRLVGRCVNDVWTIDLKGSFPTRDGQRVNALTVRDLASGYMLCVRHVGTGDEGAIGTVMLGLFRRYGLPRALRMDNGAPFGAGGPRGWSRLSASWVKLGLRLEYGRPRCPQDNPAHEQMHRVLKADACRPASRNLAAQQRRFERWRHRYNHRRPLERTSLRVPAALYHASARRLPKALPRWTYPDNWLRLYPDAKGRCQWRQRQRLIGQAFVHEELGAKPLGPDRLEVYFGPHFIGTLHARDLAGLRPVLWRPSPVAGGAAPLPNPP
jgi:putative transposase